MYAAGIEPHTGIKYIYDVSDVLARTPVGRLSDGQLVQRVQWSNGTQIDLIDC